MLNRHRGMSAKELSEIIWSDKKYDNPTGNLRCTLYRLRNMFELMSENELIVTTKTGYRINTKLKIHTEYECFEDICANTSAYAGKAERIEANRDTTSQRCFFVNNAERRQSAWRISVKE